MQRWRLLQAEIKTWTEGHFSAPPAMVLARPFTLLLFLVVCGPIASAQEYTLEQIRKGYLENINRIVTLSVEWNTSFSYPDDLVVKLPPERVTWVEQGDKLYEERNSLGDSSRKYVRCTDGKSVWVTEYLPGEDVPEVIFQSSFDEVFAVETRRLQGIGIYYGRSIVANPDYSLSEYSLDSLISEGVFSVVGRENTFGADCVVIECQGWKREGDPLELAIKCWIDPQSGFLPRKVRRGSPKGELESGFDVSIVKSVDCRGGPVFFPLNISSVKGGKVVKNLQVANVAINESVGIDLFRPKKFPGVDIVKVADRARYEAARKSLSEKRSATSPVPRKSVGTKVEGDRNSPAQISATPVDRTAYLASVVLVAGVSLITLATFLHFKSSR